MTDTGMDNYELKPGRYILKNGVAWIRILCEGASPVEADELATKLTMALNGAAYLIRLNMVRDNIEKRRKDKTINP